ncbi:nucleotidyl transferase AbiEii/AbiGii toxin family protein [Myxococcota bacterium]|nr:nucleotidyl transferase AbiEii/AbiGii toxin family protein [Myxococcota bacterium]
MDRVTRLTARERSELFSESALRRGTTPAVIEKDFWVTWVLGQLFGTPQIARLLIFKGGTSLSKVYGLIERFSEDIDLVLDWRMFADDDPFAERSKTRQQRLNRAIDEKAQGFIAGELFERIKKQVGDICQCTPDPDDSHIINIQYPGAFADRYLRPEVRLEIGPLASWLPYEKRLITPYAAEEFPDIFEQKECLVKVIKAERTFWEKATILHHEAHRPESSPQPPRYSRHYYDLAKMAQALVKDEALNDLDLLANVVEFKERFYPRKWARYDLARPGSMRLIPNQDIVATVRSDYRAMRNMIFGEAPSFDELIEILKTLEDEINGKISGSKI